MGRNGSGLYTPPSSQYPIVNGTLGDADQVTAIIADLATGISESLAKDGQTTPTANLPMNGFKLTGVGPGTARTDAATLANVQDGTGLFVSSVGGTVDAITLAPSPAIATYTTGQMFRFVAAGLNTGAVTIAVSGLSAKDVTKNGTTALVAGDIPSGSMVHVTYDGTRFILGTHLTADIVTLTGSQTLVNKTLTTCTVTADPTTALGVASKQYADAVGFTTGDVKLTMKTSADTGFVLMNDGTIGSASSAATTRANADTQSLYVLLWTNVLDAWAPVIGGRGASALDDFSANKPMRLPLTLGRALAGYGTGTVSVSGTDGDVDITNNGMVVASNNTKWITGMSVTFTLSSGTITGLTSGNTYYVIRSSATLVQLASTLANAQNGTAIDFTAKSSPIWTITHTYTARVLGEAVGEEAHAESITELLAHTHGTGLTLIPGSGLDQFTGSPKTSTTITDSTGGNQAMNIMQPTAFLNVMVKL